MRSLSPLVRTLKRSTLTRTTVQTMSSQRRPQSTSSSTSPAPPMYQHESTLPNLPVPTISSTAQKYLDSTIPFLSPQEPGTPSASTSNPTPEFERTSKVVKEFESSPLVAELQKRLEKRANDEGRESWLSEWWNETAYFGYRDPVVPYVNYFYAHRDDRSRRDGPKRAASLVRALLYFRRLTETGQLAPEKTRNGPLAMASYKYLFNACRYPVKDVDTAKKFDIESGKYEHVVAIRKGKFYEVPIVRDDGEWLSADELEQQFQKIVDSTTSEETSPIGALTTENRDVWASLRQELVSDSSNAANLERVESAIVLVALDDKKPVTREELSWCLWVGDGKNRFFDKHQIIVTDNGKSGFNGEHSCLDGTPTSRLNDWLVRSLSENKIDLGKPSGSSLPEPKHLTFNLTPSIKEGISKAISNHRKLMDDHSLSVLHYEGYGKNLIKKFKTSPDSWTQLVMQLAYYKMTGKIAPTYESAQTRKFKLGRTEVIRSATKEGLEWCKAMEDSNVEDKVRYELLKKAVAAHLKFAGWAADGQGVDRHLFGLKKLLREGEELPEIYKDPAFAQSGHWILSTSQLASEYFSGWGYGEVVPDGYGLAYAVNNDSLRFTVTSLNRNTDKFVHYLQEAATEVRQVMESGLKQLEAEEGKEKAKL